MQPAAYRNYLLTLLTVILAFNFVDRLTVGILLQPIKVDLQLSDTQLGVMTGIAFALFYAVMGIPIARWADRGNRVTIISLTAAIWSAAVAMCGATTSFLQLLLMRVIVGVGEAGCIPPAQSLIADYFPRAERARAIARYMLGGPLAMIIGYFAAGWLNELFGWRLTFVILGVPGVVLAMLAWSTLKEPRVARLTPQLAAAASPTAAGTASDEPGIREVCATLWANTSFRHLLLGFSVFFFFGYGVLQWQPAFFIRSHGVRTAELGLWFALAIGLASALGLYFGGELASRYAAGNETAQLKVSAAVFAVLAAVKAYAYLAPDHYRAFAALALASILSSLTQGPLYATIQTLVPPRMRAMAIALVLLFANLIGMGLGPLTVGAISDSLRPWLAEESLRYALVLMCPLYLWAAWHVWRASRTVMRDLSSPQVPGNYAPSHGAPELAVSKR
jgi:MFS family permease